MLVCVKFQFDGETNLRQDEVKVLDTFLYEAIFIPEGVLIVIILILGVDIIGCIIGGFSN